MRTITSLGIIVTAMLLMAVAGGGAAHAQYPPPSGSVTVSADNTTVEVGDNVDITVTVRDVTGSPVVKRSCRLAIVSQPGKDASVKPKNAKTNEEGVIEATVDVGSTPGFIVVRVTCGDVAGSVTVVATAKAETPATGQAPESGIELPSTGGGSGSGASGLGMRLGAGAAIVLLLVGAQAVRTYRRRRAS